MNRNETSRLQFTDAERGDPRLRKHIRRADKAADKLEKAQASIPKQKKRIKSSLRFEEVEKPAPAAGLSHTVKAAPLNVVFNQAHRKIREQEKDNTGLETAHTLEGAAETGVRLAAHSNRVRKLRPYREAARSTMRLEKANVNALYQKHLRDHSQPASNPLSRWRQKRAIQKQYAKSVRSGQSVAATMENASQAAKRAAAASKRTQRFFRRHKRGLGIAAALFLMLCVFLNGFSSCSVLVEGVLSSLGSSTYPSRDADMLGAEAAYAGMEAELQTYLDTYESTHGYDQYHYDLDEIKHDPYVLISILTAYHRGAWTLEEVRGTLEMLFDRQYTLTETVSTETRYGSDNEPYEYSVCTVTLKNFDLSHLPIYVLDQEGMNLYAVYMATLGNRPDLFPTGEYPNASHREDYLDYEVPLEALEDETFQKILTEAEKYLGYPYVWGGSSPSTSFDCSGYVSWVINHSGWDVGRLGAQGLCNLCTPVSPANARPGDLVFFKGTYDTPGVSHCGIYVGNGMMLHCGSPISYANLNTRYWQDHLFCYGRLP